MNHFNSDHKFSTREGYGHTLGATCEADGVNFALFSANARRVELCLFEAHGAEESARIEMLHRTDQVWHVFVEGVQAGTRYAYRVYGQFDPQRGHRFNPYKLLLDPYARQIDGDFQWTPSVYGYNPESSAKDLELCDKNNAADMPKCVVVSKDEMVLGDLPEPHTNKPNIPRNKTVIYETHVKGFTQLNPAVPEQDRGKYSGLSHPDVLAYIRDLGVTSIELLPVHGFIDEAFIKNNGLSNYWGYNSLHFFCPHKAYSVTGHPKEFKRMVSAIHEAGLEVILDVVYNHTAEGNHLGPTLSFRGIDNASYYGLELQDQRLYVNDTGCGNTLNIRHPRVLQMVMDSLRYWAHDMGVDGFRFDLATVLGRESYGFDPGSGFFDAVRQDPVLSKVKLIAEPWDIGPGGYQLGNYPSGWSEWNDRYRDTCRRFWKGDRGLLPEFARRIHGSSDLFEHSGRAPSASINLITSHDGFTLHDIVTYSEKHNEQNKEYNRDGHHANYSENYGVEGETEIEKINILRQRQRRNLIATLILSQGTPMILAGDEFGRTQQGNNNAYCQDNELNWIDWAGVDEHGQDLRRFVRSALALRKRLSLLTSKRYMHRPDEPEREIKSVVRWVNDQGEDMQEAHWTEQNVSTLGLVLEQYPVMCTFSVDGKHPDVDVRAKQRILLLFNSGSEDVEFRLPVGTPDLDGVEARYWKEELDTYEPDGKPKIYLQAKGATVFLRAHSMQVLVANFES